MALKNTTLEHNIQNEIRIWCGEHNLLSIRINVGTFRTLDGYRIIKSGPPKGWPDLQILDNNGKIIFCECKDATGKERNEQKKIHKILRERGFKVIVPHSLEEFVKEMKEYE